MDYYYVLGPVCLDLIAEKSQSFLLITDCLPYDVRDQPIDRLDFCEDPNNNLSLIYIFYNKHPLFKFHKCNLKRIRSQDLYEKFKSLELNTERVYFKYKNMLLKNNYRNEPYYLESLINISKLKRGENETEYNDIKSAYMKFKQLNNLEETDKEKVLSLIYDKLNLEDSKNDASLSEYLESNLKSLGLVEEDLKNYYEYKDYEQYLKLEGKKVLKHIVKVYIKNNKNKEKIKDVKNKIESLKKARDQSKVKNIIAMKENEIKIMENNHDLKNKEIELSLRELKKVHKSLNTDFIFKLASSYLKENNEGFLNFVINTLSFQDLNMNDIIVSSIRDKFKLNLELNEEVTKNVSTVMNEKKKIKSDKLKFYRNTFTANSTKYSPLDETSKIFKELKSLFPENVHQILNRGLKLSKTKKIILKTLLSAFKIIINSTRLTITEKINLRSFKAFLEKLINDCEEEESSYSQNNANVIQNLIERIFNIEKFLNIMSDEINEEEEEDNYVQLEPEEEDYSSLFPNFMVAKIDKC